MVNVNAMIVKMMDGSIKELAAKKVGEDKYISECGNHHIVWTWFPAMFKEVAAPETPKEEVKAPKAAKLSPTMQKVMDKLQKADWYYMYNGKTCEHFANESGRRPIGYEGAGIVEGGYVYNQMDSKTLRALEKRGLVEIAHDGKDSLDAIKVVGMELPERLAKALHVKITTPFYGGKTITYDGFVTSESAVKHLLEWFNPRSDKAVSYEIVGEVELSVWDFFKNK